MHDVAFLAMDPAKPGYTTTEFWLTLLTNLAAAVTLLAPQLGVKLGDPALVKSVAGAAAALATIAYTLSRSKVKAAAAHPLAYAPVPQEPLRAGAALPFHGGASDLAPSAAERDDFLPVSDEDHAAALAAHAKAQARRRPVTKKS